MAEVFLASTIGAEGFQRPVAIKRVLPSFSNDNHFATMFVNEARISAMLRHPNIVQVLDFDRDPEGRLFLVMELVEGKDLADLARAAQMPIPVVVYTIAEVLEGLAHAHEMTTADGRALGLVHRDISPHNVLVSWDGAVKVSDFGIAKAMQASGAAASGMIKGKPLYMAPEQVTSPDTVDSRADLFAVGVMFYELLTGKRIYQGNSNEEILTDVIQVARGWRQLVPPNTLRPDLPWDVCQVCLMLLAPDRNQRFATARDALDAILRTTSAPTRGAAMLSELMGQTYPTEVPKRRQSLQQRAAQSSAAETVLAQSGEVAAVMGAPTRTIEPIPSTPVTGGMPRAVAIGSQVQPQQTVGTQLVAPARSRTPLIVALVFIVGVLGTAVFFLATRGGAGGGGEPKPTPAVSVDAAPAAVKPADAAPVVAAPDAAPIVDAGDAPPDAKKKRDGHDPKKVDAGARKPTGKEPWERCPTPIPNDNDCDGIPDER